MTLHPKKRESVRPKRKTHADSRAPSRRARLPGGASDSPSAGLASSFVSTPTLPSVPPDDRRFLPTTPSPGARPPQFPAPSGRGPNDTGPAGEWSRVPPAPADNAKVWFPATEGSHVHRGARRCGAGVILQLGVGLLVLRLEELWGYNPRLAVRPAPYLHTSCERPRATTRPGVGTCHAQSTGSRRYTLQLHVTHRIDWKVAHHDRLVPLSHLLPSSAPRGHSAGRNLEKTITCRAKSKGSPRTSPAKWGRRTTECDDAQPKGNNEASGGPANLGLLQGVPSGIYDLANSAENWPGATTASSSLRSYPRRAAKPPQRAVATENSTPSRAKEGGSRSPGPSPPGTTVGTASKRRKRTSSPKEKEGASGGGPRRQYTKHRSPDDDPPTRKPRNA